MDRMDRIRGYKQRREMERMSGSALTAYQLGRLNQLLAVILPRNEFYADKLANVPHEFESLEQLGELPFTFKEELLGDGRSDFAANRTYPVDRYVRFHRTSGTHGRPLVVLDTADDWQWFVDAWQYVLDTADVTPDDRVMLAFSFGPFIGFWSAHGAAADRGCLVIPGGGMTTLQRIELLMSSHTTVVCCTPTYALRMAEVAHDRDIDLAQSAVRALIVAGEPGGSMPNVRERIETAWGATVFDHSGATEVGPWGYADSDRGGLHVNEAEFVAEFISVQTGEPAVEGELSELILTTLGRYGSPVIRYRTGDLVRPSWNHELPNRFVRLDGGVLGRTDDMMIIRGMNIFPSAIEEIVRGFPEVIEFRITAETAGELDELQVEVEDRLDRPERIAEALQLRLGLRIAVRSVSIGSLPRFEGKGMRFVDHRKKT